MANWPDSGWRSSEPPCVRSSGEDSKMLKGMRCFWRMLARVRATGPAPMMAMVEWGGEGMVGGFLAGVVYGWSFFYEKC